MPSSIRSTEDYAAAIEAAAEYIRSHLGVADAVIVLGSGLAHFEEKLENRKPPLSYGDIPHFLLPSVSGHPGELIMGEIDGAKIFCLKGRSHAYEGIHMFENTFTARVMQRAGVKLFIASNSSGGAVKGMKEGGMMVIGDHINFFHRNPLSETYEDVALGERHPDCSGMYSERLRTIAKEVALSNGFELFEGVYASTPGPTYETPSEVRYCCKFGAGAFGMSTVPETTAARAVGMEVAGFSLCTNMAAGMSDETLTHSGVKEVAAKAGKRFMSYMLAFLRQLVAQNIIRKGTIEYVSHAIPSSERYKAFVGPIPSKGSSTLPVQATAHASTKDISAAVDMLGGCDRWSGAVGVCVYGCAELLPNGWMGMNVEKSVALADLPGIPCISPSVCNGLLQCGRLASHGDGYTLALRNVCWDGFVPEEAVYIARVLAQLGCNRMVHIMPVACGTQETPSEGEHRPWKVVGLQDVLPFDTLQPYVAESVPSPVGYPYAPIHPELHRSLSSCVEHVGDVMSFPPPSLPTRAEGALASQAGYLFHTITHLSLIYTCASIGIANGAVGIMEHHKGPMEEYIECVANTCRAVTDAIHHSTCDGVSPKRVSHKDTREGETQLSIHLPQPVTQGDITRIRKQAEALRATFSPSSEELPRVAILADSSAWDSFLSNGLSIKATSRGVDPPQALFSLGIIGDTPSIGVTHIPSAHGGENPSSLTSPIRVLHHLGVHTIVMVLEGMSCTSELKPGDVCLLNDHVNFSGRNPLFGHNVDEWGVRFLDSSGVYDTSLRHRIARGLKEPPHEGVGGYSIGPLYHSGAQTRLAREAGCSVLLTTGLPQAIVAQHMGIRLVCLVVIGASDPSESLVHLPPETMKESYERLSSSLEGILIECGSDDADE